MMSEERMNIWDQLELDDVGHPVWEEEDRSSESEEEVFGEYENDADHRDGDDDDDEEEERMMEDRQREEEREQFRIVGYADLQPVGFDLFGDTEDNQQHCETDDAMEMTDLPNTSKDETLTWYKAKTAVWCSEPPLASKTQARNILKIPKDMVPSTSTVRHPTDAFSLFIGRDIIRDVVKFTNIEGRRVRDGGSSSAPHQYHYHLFSPLPHDHLSKWHCHHHHGYHHHLSI